MYKFSVVIPVHNGADYLAKTLRSILDQSYQNFMITILENCSRDQTMEIIKSFNDDRIEIIPSTQLLNIEDNWGRILDIELQEYMTIVCHDDLLHPHYLEEMAHCIEVEPEATLYTSQLSIVDSESKFSAQGLAVPYKESGDEFLRRFHAFQRNVVGSGYVMRSADFRSVGGLPRLPGLLFSDVICWYKLSNLSYKICSSRVLYSFRHHAQSAGQSAKLLALDRAMKVYFQTLKAEGHFASPEAMQLTYCYLTNFFMLRYRSLLNEASVRTDNNRLAEFNLNRPHLHEFEFFVYNNKIRLREYVALLPSVHVRRLLLKALG